MKAWGVMKDVRSEPTNKLAAFLQPMCTNYLLRKDTLILHFLTIVFTKLTLQLRK